MNETVSNDRKPWVAAVLPLFCTGLGHIYCGRIGNGLVLFLGSLLFAPFAVAAAFLGPSTPVLVALILGLLFVLGLYLFAVVDAYRLARRSGEGYRPHDYNRGLLYALFILVGVTYPAGVLSYLRSNYFEAFVVPTASGVPNILPGDRILVNKAVVRDRIPRRGDVVVFRRPTDRRINYVKRVIALPGDAVAVRSGQVYVNGKPLERDRLPRGLASVPQDVAGKVFTESNAGSRYMIALEPAATPSDDYPEHSVPEDACFVLGDNRNHTLDSRKFGFVPLGDVIGVVQYVYFPAQDWSRFGTFGD